MKKTLIIGVAMVMASCAPLQGTFVRTGYEKVGFEQAKARCCYEVEMGFRGAPHYVTQFYGAPPPPGVAMGAAIGDAIGNIAIAIGNAERQKQLFLRCMEAHGYRFVPGSQ